MSGKSRIIIVVNKYWECDPFIWVLTSKYIYETCGIKLGTPSMSKYPAYGPVKDIHPKPRLLFETNSKEAEVWCISDLLSVYTDTPDYQSSSKLKTEVLDQVFTYNSNPIELVVAVGTASSGPDITSQLDGKNNVNGSVIVGGKVFMYDGYTEHAPSEPPKPPLNPDNHFECNYFDTVMCSSLLDEKDAFDFFKSQAIHKKVDTLLLCPPAFPTPNNQHIYVDGNYVAIGDVNVWDYKEYPQKDKLAGDAYATAYPNDKCGVSVETTHGLIYSAARKHNNDQNPPFMFVSGIVDRFDLFEKDVKPQVYAQNVSGAHNAGVFIAYLLSDLLYKLQID